MDTNGTFNAKLIASSYRTYRVYLKRADIFFIVIAGGLSANPDMLTVHFGLVGALIGHFVKKRAKKKSEATIQRIDQVDPEELVSEHKHNFKLHTSEIREARVEPRPWLVMSGNQAGRCKFFLRDGRKMNFEFETTEDMSAALNLLPQLLNSSLVVNVEWDEQKKRYRKKKATA